MIYINNYVNRI